MRNKRKVEEIKLNSGISIDPRMLGSPTNRSCCRSLESTTYSSSLLLSCPLSTIICYFCWGSVIIIKGGRRTIWSNSNRHEGRSKNKDGTAHSPPLVGLAVGHDKRCTIIQCSIQIYACSRRSHRRKEEWHHECRSGTTTNVVVLVVASSTNEGGRRWPG